MVLELILTLGYIFYVVYVSWISFLNIVLSIGTRAIRGEAWKVEIPVALLYISLWTLVIFLPILKAAVLPGEVA